MQNKNSGSTKKIKKVTKKSKKKKSKILLSYDYFKIPTLDNFNYTKYDQPWCRYCGARYSYRFHESIYGKKTLCNKHYKQKRK